MASNEDVPPPLEDMSEMLEQIKAMREIKERQEQKQREKSKPKTTEEVTELYNRKKNCSDNSQSDTQKTKVSNSNSCKSAPKSTGQTKDKGFGGFQKGFLFGSGTKSKTVKHDIKENGMVPKSSTSDKPKSKTSLEDIPFIQKKEKEETLKLEEVQENMNKTGENLLKNQEWVTDDLLSKMDTNQSLMKGFQNPEYVKIIGEFQKDPQKAVEKYKDHTDFQEFFREFCKLMGDHFSELGPQESNQPTEHAGNGDYSKPKISVVPDSEQAQLSVHSSTNPKQPTAEDEQRMQEILSDPEIRTVLMDPKIAELFDVARNNPEAAQRLVHSGDDDFKQKIQKLVKAGLLQFQV